jgi:signal transduction histidine kinase
VFERGFRTPQAKASVPHGTGLGLWLVRKILAAHDAQIACTDERDDGATRVVFRITFPHPGPARGARRSG